MAHPRRRARRLRHLFLLDPDVVFLNHGSFGACPRPVFEEYQRLQLELEREPVEFLSRYRRYPALIDAAKKRLAGYLGTDPRNLVFTTNATEALNAVARSLPLAPGDEVLAPVGEYEGVEMLWRYICTRAGARYVTTKIPPGAGEEEAVERLWAGLTPATRVVVASHVSCYTGVVFPVEELCRRARDRGIASIIDGAHAPGQIPLELDRLGADFYGGNCHKWLCAPKGAGFLYVRPELQEMLEPFVVSWDWEQEAEFADRRRWQGTRDPAAWLCVPAAIDFQAQNDWPRVRDRCHDLAVAARARLAEVLRLEPVTPNDDSFVQMVGVPLRPCDPYALQRRLFEEHRIEVLAQPLEGVPIMRLSFQAYNDETDLDRLVEAVESVFI